MKPRHTLPLALLLACAPALSAEPAQVTTLESETAAVDRYATGHRSMVENRLAATFTPLAGSPENASALVSGLRDGTPVNLMATAPDGSTTITGFAPATGPMGYGNVRISMTLAEQQLASLGITNPTPEQLVAALNGGPITYVGRDGVATTASLKGVLEQRAAGLGWGEIAQSQGTKLGPVINGLKTTQNGAANPLPASRAAGPRSASTLPMDSATRGSANGITAGDKARPPATANSQGQGNAYGKGIATAFGASSEGVGATNSSQGQAHGTKAVPPTTGTASAGSGTVAAAGVSTAQGNGNAYGQSKAHGKN